MKKIMLKIFILFFIIMLLACGNNPPKIKQVKKQINFLYSEEDDKVVFEVCVFISFEDEDGEEDLESIYIISDKNEVYWFVDKRDWVIREEFGIKWIGYEHFRNVNNEVPYPGTYRLIIIDQAGERDETSTYIPVINVIPQKKDFPKLQKTDNKEIIEIKSPNSNNILSFYNKNNNIIKVISVTPGYLDLTSIKDVDLQADCSYINISTYSDRFGGGIILEGFSIK